MDLWIRSQDKKTLTKADDIYVQQENSEEYYLRSRCILGVYKTEKRALEVLDKIQKLMTQNVVYFSDSPAQFDLKECMKIKEYADTYGVIPNDKAIGEIKYISPNLVVFEMPNE